MENKFRHETGKQRRLAKQHKNNTGLIKCAKCGNFSTGEFNEVTFYEHNGDYFCQQHYPGKLIGNGSAKVRKTA